MKKPKLNIDFGEGGFQGWLVRHCEKMILGVIILLALWVIWGGYGLSGLEGNKTPDALRATATEKRSSITQTTWESFTQANPERLQRSVNKLPSDDPVDPLHYPPHFSWNPRDFKPLVKRADPEIYPPINLKAVPFVGSVAYQPVAGMKDGLTGKSGSGAGAPQRIGVAGGGAGRLGPMGISAEPGAEPGGGADDLLSQFADSGAAPGEEPGGPMDLGGTGGMSGAGGVRVQPLESSHYQAPPNSIPQTRYAVVLMAAVQHEKQWGEFDRKLKDALDFDQMRDQPNYLTFFVQRVDVTADPEVDPAAIAENAWQNVSNKAVLDDAMKWAGYPKEVVDPNCLSPVDPAGMRMGLTQPIPPFVQRDLWEAMTHPDIPLASAARQTPSQFMPAEGAEEAGDVIPGIPGLPGVGAAAGGRSVAGGAGGMMPGMGAGGMMPGIGTGGMMPGMGAGGMMPGMGMGQQLATVGPLVKYKLLRVTDISVEPGHKYRYRLKVVVDDPNNPTPGLSQMYQAPRLTSLSQDVQTRLGGEGAKQTYRESAQWSEPSDVVSLPADSWFYAGKVDSDSGQTLVPGTRPVRREPTAKVLAIVHDPEKGADIPVEQEVRPGSTFNLKTEVNVVHPINGMIHNFKDYALHTDTLVADILGGEAIPNIHKDRSGNKMTVPGEILLIDADGNLFVQDEAEDATDFLRYVPPEEEKKPAVGIDPMNPMDPMGGMEPGAELGPGESAPPMGRRGRRGM